MLSDTSSALPRPLSSRSRVAMSSRISATICSSRDLELSTRCMVPQRCLSWASATSFSPWVLAANHWSILAGEVRFWSTSRAS